MYLTGAAATLLAATTAAAMANVIFMNDSLYRDGNFKSDGDLLLPCSERDVDVTEYRRVIEQCIRYRDRVRSQR